MEKLVLLYFYVPESHLEAVKKALFDVGIGRIGHYSCCCWQTKGIGQFKPDQTSSPHIGQKEQINQFEEYKVEMVCQQQQLTQAIKTLKAAHPYEEVAFGALTHCEDL